MSDLLPGDFDALAAEIERLRDERDRWKGYAKAQREGRHRLVEVITVAKRSLADIEAVLKTMRDSGALSLAEWFSIEGMVRFTRTHLLDTSDD